MRRRVVVALIAIAAAFVAGFLGGAFTEANWYEED